MHQRPNTIERVDDDETKLCEVRRHPFGIIILYVQVVLGMIVAVFLAFYLVPSVMDDRESAFVLASVFSAFAVLSAFVVMAIAGYVYKQSKIIITDRNITQVLQYGLFSRKVSQLNIVNVEDVTSVQDGILSTMMGYGTLNIETAGEQSNFHFTYCPNSGRCAKIILDAREQMLGQMEASGAGALHHPKTEVNVALKAKRTVAKRKKSPSIKGIGAEVIERARS